MSTKSEQKPMAQRVRAFIDPSVPAGGYRLGAGQILSQLETLRLAEAATAGNEDVGALDVHIGAALFAARHHRRLLDLRGELEAELLDRRVAIAALSDLKRVQPPDDDADLRAGATHRRGRLS